MAGDIRIMIFDLDRVRCELKDLGIREAEAFALRLRHGQVLCAAAASIDHAQLFSSERTAQNSAVAGAEGRLVDIELIGINGTLHNILAQPVHAGNEHDIAEARFGVQGEHNAARGAIGSHHLHHSDGKADLEMIKSVVDTIGDRPVSEN